jgi:hypothetical protein
MMSRKRTPSGLSASSSALISSRNEMIEVSGVRSSWDTMATNCEVGSAGGLLARPAPRAAPGGSAGTSVKVASVPAGRPAWRSATTEPRTRVSPPVAVFSRAAKAISG